MTAATGHFVLNRMFEPWFINSRYCRPLCFAIRRNSISRCNNSTRFAWWVSFRSETVASCDIFDAMGNVIKTPRRDPAVSQKGTVGGIGGPH